MTKHPILTPDEPEIDRNFRDAHVWPFSSSKQQNFLLIYNEAISSFLLNYSPSFKAVSPISAELKALIMQKV